MRSLAASLVIALALVTAACGGASTSTTSPTNVGGTPVTPLHGTMTAVIDGSPWTAVAITTASYTSGIVAIGGADSSNPIRSIGLSITAPTAGTYPISTGSANAVLSIGIGPTWTANVLGGTGTVTLTSLSSTAAVGTFSFTAVPAAGGAAGNHAVTTGAFNITF
jgi:hypothetical protein